MQPPFSCPGHIHISAYRRLPSARCTCRKYVRDPAVQRRIQIPGPSPPAAASLSARNSFRRKHSFLFPSLSEIGAECHVAALFHYRNRLLVEVRDVCPDAFHSIERIFPAQRKRSGFPLRSRLVYRGNQFNGPPAVLARDCDVSAGFQRGQHIVQLAGMHFIGNGRQGGNERVGLFPKSPVGLLQRESVGLRLGGKYAVRRGDLCLLALEYQFLILPVMHHGSCHGCQRARVFHHGNGKILHLRVIVCRIGQNTGHPFRGTHHPAQHIDMMHRMVQRASTAFLLPGTPPPQIVIAVAPEPERIDLRMTDRPGHPAVQQGLQVPDRLPETVLRDNGKLLSALVPGFQHGVTLLQGSRHGFFAYYVLPAPQAVDTDLRVHKRRCADVHQIDILPVQNVMMIQEHFRVQTVLFLDTPGFSGDNVHKSNDPAALRKVQVRADVRMGDSAGSDDCDTNHANAPLCCLIPLNYPAFSLCTEYTCISRAILYKSCFNVCRSCTI
uniref:Hypothetical transcriptional regulator n=1 Tax=uncultured microorganism TaxID=358574 RepID=I3PGA8_9ZZZZ|nr:hypothetical transcriptional regulator [uncultured microorganism]